MSGIAKITLKRSTSTDDGTFGAMTLPDGTVIRTAELPWRGNERQKSSIPAGAYKCSIVQSPKFGRVYGVQNVPGRSHILIHAGNYAGDTSKGKRSDVQGCILVGKSVGVLSGQQAVLQSRVVLAEFMQKMNGNDFMLEIV